MYLRRELRNERNALLNVCKCKFEFNEGLSFNFGKRGKIGKKVSKTRFLLPLAIPLHYDSHICTHNFPLFLIVFSPPPTSTNSFEVYFTLCLDLKLVEKGLLFMGNPQKVLLSSHLVSILLHFKFHLFNFCFYGSGNMHNQNTLVYMLDPLDSIPFYSNEFRQK